MSLKPLELLKTRHFYTILKVVQLRAELFGNMIRKVRFVFQTTKNRINLTYASMPGTLDMAWLFEGLPPYVTWDARQTSPREGRCPYTGDGILVSRGRWRDQSICSPPNLQRQERQDIGRQTRRKWRHSRRQRTWEFLRIKLLLKAIRTND